MHRKKKRAASRRKKGGRLIERLGTKQIGDWGHKNPSGWLGGGGSGKKKWGREGGKD